MSNVIDFKSYLRRDFKKRKSFKYKDDVATRMLDNGVEFGFIFERKDAHMIVNKDAIPNDLKFLIVSDNDEILDFADASSGTYFVDLGDIDNE